MASGLVFGVELVPEGGRLEVEGKGNRIRGSFLTDLQKDGEKAIDAVGIDAILGGERAHAVVSPVEYAVGVDGEQLHTCKILSLNGIITCTPAGTDRRRGQTDKNRTGKASVPSWGQGDLHQPIIA